ncbi:MAG: DUF4837 family protein [Candidatus Krumholzibacteria bacterium]|nr:DUF4837 family protein [Candidatus Krumholzibacteria bacterium]
MRRTVLTTIFFAFVFFSCGRQSSFPPAGSYSDIVLVTETGKIEGATGAIIRELQHPLDYYTKMELQFRVKVIPVERIEKEPPSKNVVLFGVVRQGDIGGIIESFIGVAGVRSVLEGKSNVFRKLDYPVKGQLTVIVTASSRNLLEKVVKEDGELIRDIIEDANRERLRDYLLQRGEKVEISKELHAKHGFTIRVPYLYELNQERDDVPGIELVRIKPHRGLSISWRSWEKRGISVADSTDLYDTRSRIAWEMYDKDVMRRDLVYFHNDRLGPYDAVRMEGYWENSEELYGGSFICFFVYDRVRSRMWIVDCVVYAPGFGKHTLLRELVAVAETFRIG